MQSFYWEKTLKFGFKNTQGGSITFGSWLFSQCFTLFSLIMHNELHIFISNVGYQQSTTRILQVLWLCPHIIAQELTEEMEQGVEGSKTQNEGYTVLVTPRKPQPEVKHHLVAKTAIKSGIMFCVCECIMCSAGAFCFDMEGFGRGFEKIMTSFCWLN